MGDSPHAATSQNRGFDPEALMEQMRRQNEAMLESHKRQIEQQYKEQMQLFMQTFAPPTRNTGHGLLQQMKLKRPVLRDVDADAETTKFYSHAQGRGSAPQLDILEGKSKTHTLRAVAEGGPSNSYIVRTSGAPHAASDEVAHGFAEESLKVKRPAKKVVELHPSLRNNPLGDSVAPASWKKNIDLRKKSAAASKNSKDEDDTLEQESDISKGGSDEAQGAQVNEDIDFQKFDDVTQYMLKKTAFLVNDTKEVLRASKPPKKKNIQRKLQKAPARDEEEEQDFEDIADDVVQEDPDAEARDGSAFGRVRLPALQTPDMVNKHETKRNILVKSVDFQEQILPPVVDKKEPAIHPDYQWEGETRVNNYEYEVDPHLALHKSEWENEIARHILSVYATSRSNENISESKSILKYVDIDREDSLKGVEDYVKSEDGRKADDENVVRPLLNDDGMQSDTLHEDRQELSGDNPALMTKTAKEGGLELTRMEKSFRNHSKYRSCLVVRVGRTGKTGGKPHNPGEEISIRGSPRCFPIWFVSSGEIYSNWTRLPGGEKLQGQLFNLYEKQFFKEYLGILEKIIDDLWRERTLGKIEGVEDFLNPRHSTRKRVQLDEKVRLVGKDGRIIQKLKDHKQKEVVAEVKRPDHHTGEGAWVDEDPNGNVWQKIAADEKQEEAKKAELSDDEIISLWGQLILTANAFGVLLIEKKNYDLALAILQKAETWCKRGDFLPKQIRLEIMPHIQDTLAFYFYKRGKFMSSMTYTQLALKDHETLGNLDNICSCLLHIAALQNQGGDFKEAHKTLYQVLAMIEEGQLAFESATPKQLCLVAVAYHNLAVIQMKLLVPDLACKSSQNARKIARLCLSYSNRWLNIFQWTHEAALEDVRFQLTLKPGIPLNDKQLHVIKELTAEMYDPNA